MAASQEETPFRATMGGVGETDGMRPPNRHTEKQTPLLDADLYWSFDGESHARIRRL